jgi:adenosylhomocysteine nucleosidase
MERIGIICGVPEELAAFLPEQARVAVEGAPFGVARIDYAGKALFAACAGIGKVAAATAATWLHARCGVEFLIVIGTAGKIGAAEGDLFHVVEAVQADYGAQRSEGLVHYTAGAMPIGPAVIQAFRSADIPAAGLPGARIATSDLFIECGVHAARVRERLDAVLVDMETAAVAQTAALLGLGWTAFKATTDGADGDSSTTFFENLQAAARAAAEAARATIEAL